MATAVSTRESGTGSKVLQAGAMALVAAVIANVIVFFISTALLALTVEFSMPPGSPIQPLELVMVIVSTAFGAIGATIVFALLNRFVARPITVFYVVSAVVLLLSLGGPLSLNASATTTAVLITMHIVAAIVIVGVLTRFSRAS